MASEAGSSQPPPEAPDKQQPGKPAASGFSAFVNKSGAGRAFKPKAPARRRPGPAQATRPPPEKSPAPAAPQAEQTQIQPPTAPLQEPPTAPQPAPQLALPTPAATQEPALTAHPPPSSPNVQSILSSQNVPETPAAVETSSEQTAKSTTTVPPLVPTPVQVAIAPSALGTAPSETPAETSASALAAKDTNTQATSSETPAAISPSVAGTNGTRQPTDATPSNSQAQPKRRKRVLPWLAVNRQHAYADEEEAIRPSASTRPPVKSRSKRKTGPGPVPTAENEPEGEESRTRSKPLSERAKGKRKATDATPEGEAFEPIAKKPRKVRKDKGIKRKNADALGGGTEEEVPADYDEAQPSQQRASIRKKWAPRQAENVSEDTQEQASGAENDGEPPRRKRKPRKPRERARTPSDAEDREIEPEDTFMDDLASHNIKVGKLSEREKKMRTINWKEVAQRRRDEEERALMMRSRNTGTRNEALDGETEAEQNGGLQMHVINGEIRFVQGSGVIDRDGDAEREREGYEVVEDDDLTRRVNNRSWMFNNKRFPEDYVGIAQGKPMRWSAEATEQFYEGLRICGTDFKMISTMFPGSTRRSIKTKFTREERENPEFVKAALRREGDPEYDRNEEWRKYLERTGQTDDAFVDVDAVYRELEEERKTMQVEIDAAKARFDEEKRQRRLAGAELSEDEAVDGSAKENSRKKKRKGKQPVVFEEEEGVEILGLIDD
ncbi:uncharacterized protein BDR25DRAFT_280799 [Lindgomyces ingoldianus]|uniref:Uncharacterized protein n=1 Tax=Lindgomyces ingoldianus TaxID=673940 RepID=A0ACB6R459_9PLEO|nr:uncharacterized protein BDR25DRAFT_280799 [Lindgomyces ingoldianus]KAF2474078.1 hypothetical protein BDR25DRAFT_280799 [Lindgomyces ingoldianus]